MPASSELSLEDRVQIGDLLIRYAWALDMGDIEALAACFTEDCVLVEEVFEEPDYWRGREGIRALGEHYRASANFAGRQHHVSQSQFEADGVLVRARSYVFVTECRGEPPYLIRFTGWYRDILSRSDGRWLIKERRIALWDGPALKNFPGQTGERAPRKRPPDLVIRR